MGSFSRVALQGDIRGLCSFLLLGFLLYTTTSGLPASAADGSAACRNPVARVVSIQGTVEMQAVGQARWSPVTRLDSPLCNGDKLRTGPASRSALFVHPESVVRVDRNTTIAINQLPDETLIEFFQDELRPVASNSCGAGYFISRFPKKFKVKAPYLSAAVEGTEFLVALSCESDLISVFEGKVLASQSTGSGQSVLLEAGQTATAGPGEAPVIKLNIKPEDAVQWVVYYPPITPPDASIEEDCRNVASDRRAACLVARAERLLRAGNVDEARNQINDAIAVAPLSSDAKALQSIISLVRNEKSEALRFANEAVAADPKSAPAWLALSYAQQSDFKLEAALTSAQKAVEITPNSSLALARVAELQLSLGWNREAEKTAKQAVATNDAESRAHMILGFVHLAQIKVKEARGDFERAIELDSTDPLPRLGIGLAIIRKGNLVEGREQIEIAVALDPKNSLIRSYVGKAYYEENSKERNKLGSAQFGLAKALDPNDPTPWFYSAILAQTQNMPAAALKELRTSIEKNDNRAVYRSRLLLDDDAAARSASVAALYESLGFEKLAISESTKALGENAGNYAAHRELASAYANSPRHDIARVSEALQAQIRQPVSASPIDPILGTDSLLMLRNVGPSQLGLNEYNILFDQDQTRVYANGIAGNLDTFGDTILVSRLADNVSFGLSQLHYETQGFIENDSAERTGYNFFVHGQVSSTSAIQLDVRKAQLEFGQTYFPFDPELTEQDLITDDGDVFRVNGHHVIDGGTDWIWSVAHENRLRTVVFVPDNFEFSRAHISTSSVEIQNLKKIGNVQILSGIGYVNEDDFFEFEQSNIATTATSLYSSAIWRPGNSGLAIHAGIVGEWFSLENSLDTNSVERSRITPQLGLVWSPRSGTTLRAATFSTVRRPFIGGQTIQPTQVAGFNQFFTGFEQLFGDRDGTISDRVGVAMDQALSPTAFAGLEIAKRRLEVPSLMLNSDFEWRETTGHAYLYKAIAPKSAHGAVSHWSASLFAEFEYEKIERPQELTGAEGIIELRTLRAPIGVNLLNSNGITIGIGTTYVKQEGLFSADVSFPIFEKKDAAWVTDLFFQYRLPRRGGVVMIGVKNLSDNFIDLLETDPLNPRVATHRLFFGKFTLDFQVK